MSKSADRLERRAAQLDVIAKDKQTTIPDRRDAERIAASHRRRAEEIRRGGAR